MKEAPVSQDLANTGLGPPMSTLDPCPALSWTVTQLGEASEGWGCSMDLQSGPWGVCWESLEMGRDSLPTCQAGAM